MKKKLILQINVPLCVRHCAYCAQTVHKYEPELAAAYAAALLREIEAVSQDAQEYVVTAVSMEGGSPALLEPADLQKIVRAIRRHFNISESVQFSLQTMPGDYSRALMEKMRDNGVNFWTIGLETANFREHDLLDRPYRFDALTMVDTAIRTFHPRDLSFDLLYGIPGQTEKSWAHTLDVALTYEPDHLTIYPLRIIGGTRLHVDCEAGTVVPMDDAKVSALYNQAKEKLTALGYHAYTCFDFCLTGKENLFRLGQLNGMEQLGIGYQAQTIMDGYTYYNGHSLQEYLEHADDMTILARNVTKLEGTAKVAYDQARAAIMPK